MKSALIVGASRGIGLGLVDRHLADGWMVHATTRNGAPPRAHPSLTTHRLDVRDTTQLDAMAASLDQPFDRVVHNAGIMRAPRADIFEVNTDAPIRIVQRLLDGGHVKRDGVVAIMTSQMGSRRGRSGSLGDYGDSKAALNDEFRLRASSWREAGAIAIVVHPGWVQTDMGGAGASLTVEESVDGVTELLDRLTSEQHGAFLDWRGRELPW